MKLHAIEDRRPSGGMDKRASAWDIYRILVDRAARTTSWLKAGDERMARVTVEDLRSLAEPALDALDG